MDSDYGSGRSSALSAAGDATVERLEEPVGIEGKASVRPSKGISQVSALRNKFERTNPSQCEKSSSSLRNKSYVAPKRPIKSSVVANSIFLSKRNDPGNTDTNENNPTSNSPTSKVNASPFQLQRKLSAERRFSNSRKKFSEQCSDTSTTNIGTNGNLASRRSGDSVVGIKERGPSLSIRKKELLPEVNSLQDENGNVSDKDKLEQRKRKSSDSKKLIISEKSNLQSQKSSSTVVNKSLVVESKNKKSALSDGASDQLDRDPKIPLNSSIESSSILEQSCITPKISCSEVKPSVLKPRISLDNSSIGNGVKSKSYRNNSVSELINDKKDITKQLSINSSNESIGRTESLESSLLTEPHLTPVCSETNQIAIADVSNTLGEVSVSTLCVNSSSINLNDKSVKRCNIQTTSPAVPEMANKSITSPTQSMEDGLDDLNAEDPECSFVESGDEGSFGAEDEEGAQIVSGPQDVIVTKGESATLTLSFTGNPSPEVTWLKKVKCPLVSDFEWSCSN